MKNKKSKASALLFVIVITSLLSLLALNYWHKSSLLFDLVLQREKFYKNFYITKTVLNYSAGVIKKDFNNYLLQSKKQKTPIIIDLNNFVSNLAPPPQKLKAFVTINKQAKESVNSLFLSAILQNKTNKTLCQLSCLLVRDKENAFVIKNNTIGNLI